MHDQFLISSINIFIFKIIKTNYNKIKIIYQNLAFKKIKENNKKRQIKRNIKITINIYFTFKIYMFF